MTLTVSVSGDKRRNQGSYLSFSSCIKTLWSLWNPVVDSSSICLLLIFSVYIYI